MMDERQWIAIAVAAAALAAGLTWLVCHWWYGRQLRAGRERVQKAEKARLFSAQQTMQARRQIEKLQKELAARSQAAAQAEAQKQRSRELEKVLRAAVEVDAESYVKRPEHGFADTQPMR